MPNNYKTVINFRDGIQVNTDDLISNNGLVGIGSTIPRQELDVRGNVVVDGNTELNNLNVVGYTTYYGNVNVAAGYSVGIGTTVPEADFQVGIGSTAFTVTRAGVVSAAQYFGDGSTLSNLPVSVWVNPGAGDTIYALYDVGVGTEQTRDGADFGVGYEIYMDAKSGIATFEGVTAKNITVTGNANQGNITASGILGIATVNATKSISAPSFIGTITNAIRSVVASGLTDSPNISVNLVSGVGGTFTGITSFGTLRISGGVIGEGGIITATTFSGTASTAVGAQTAYSLLGDPSIQVDSVDIPGLNNTFLRSTGISTIGGSLIVDKFIGVGNTIPIQGDAAGFIGTVRTVGDLTVSKNLTLGGNISLGGSIIGDLSVSDFDVNTLNVGAAFSVTGTSEFTGQSDFESNISVDGTASLNGPVTIGATVAAQRITAVEVIPTNANILGFATIQAASVNTLSVAGDLFVSGTGIITTGFIELNGVTGIASASGFYSPTGISTLNDLIVSGGNGTFINATYIGVNTDQRPITEGIALESPSELWVSEKTGIGIGSTSGDRATNVNFYVGLKRDAGDLIDTQAIFETGVGIGTTLCSRGNKVEIYKEISIFGNNTGLGGTTVGVGATADVFIGVNTSIPASCMDLRYAKSPILLPRSSSYDPLLEGEMELNRSTDQEGALYYDTFSHRVVFIAANDAKVGIKTELEYDVNEERGFLGRLVPNENYRNNTVAPTNPPNAPVGWSTSNLVYNTQYEQYQVFGGDNIWRSLVGSATSGISMSVSGSTLTITVDGVGSVNLTLS